MIFPSPTPGYSAAVEIELLMAGQRFPVGQVGRGMLIFDRPVALPANQGELILTIDGHQRRWSVAIKPGQSPGRTILADLQDVEPIH